MLIYQQSWLHNIVPDTGSESSVMSHLLVQPARTRKNVKVVKLAAGAAPAADLITSLKFGVFVVVGRAGAVAAQKKT